MTMSKPKIFLSSACHGPNNDANCVGLCVRECLGTHTHTRTHTHTHIRVNNCQEVFYLTLPYRLLLLFYLRIGPNPSLLVVREDWLVSWLSGWWEESFETSCRIGLNYQPSWLSCPGLSVSFEHTSNSRRDILDPSDDQIRIQN